MEALDVLPSSDQWREFFDRAIIRLEVLLYGAGLIFLVAFNWTDLHRFGKFGLVAALITVCLGIVWKYGLDDRLAKAGITLASVLVGVLLALVGQVYQSGADPYQLFFLWAVLILPWTLLGKTTALWALWILLMDIGLAIYGSEQRLSSADLNASDPFYPVRYLSWLLIGFNVLCFLVVEMLPAERMKGVNRRWLRILTVLTALGYLTTLTCTTILDWESTGWIVVPILWLVAMAFIYFRFRVQSLDVFVLAASVLSVIAVVSVTLFKLLNIGGTGDFYLELLLIGGAVIGISAIAAKWLRTLAGEEDHEA